MGACALFGSALMGASTVIVKIGAGLWEILPNIERVISGFLRKIES